MARNRLDLDLIQRVDFGSDGSDLILRAGRRRLTPVTSSATALTGNSPDFTSSAAMRVRAVSEGRGDAQRARGRTGRSGERALGCERRARAGPRAGERAQGKLAVGKGCWVGLPAGLGRLRGKREWADAGGKGERGPGWEAGPRGREGGPPGLGWGEGKWAMGRFECWVSFPFLFSFLF